VNANSNIYGLLAEFADDQKILNAARAAREHGFCQMDAFTPFPVDGLSAALGQKKSCVPLIVLICAIIGGLSGYFMEWYATSVSYPVNISGRPLNTWPMFIPITFELTILSGALAAILGMLALNRLPEPHHPVFDAPNFDRASTDKFFLCIEADDRKFDAAATRCFLETLQPESISEVLK
jgi:hypothetical protein